MIDTLSCQKSHRWPLLILLALLGLGCGSSQEQFFAISSTATIPATPLSPTAPAPVPVPAALADNYTVPGNTTLRVAPEEGLLLNDTLSDATLTGHTEPSNGQLNLEQDGSFVYTPDTGFRGPTDSFAYTLSNGLDESTSTVTLSIDGMTWYIDNSEPESGADGSQANPFPTLVLSEGVSQVGDTVLVFFGTGATYDSIVLKDDQNLIGEAVGLNFETRPRVQTVLAPGQHPIITNTNGVAITLANNNSIEGLAVSDTPDNAIFGDEINGLSIENVISDSAGGAAIRLEDFSGDIVFDNLNLSNSGGNAIDLRRPSDATLTLKDSLIETPDGAGVRVSGGAGSLGGTITGNTILGPGTDGLTFVGRNSASFDLVVGGASNGNTIVDTGRLVDFDCAIGLSCESGPNRVLILDNTLRQSIVTTQACGILFFSTGSSTTSQVLIDGNLVENFNVPGAFPARVLTQQSAHIDLGFINNILVDNHGEITDIECFSGASACVRFNDNDYSANTARPSIRNGSGVDQILLEATSGNVPVGPQLQQTTEVDPGTCVDIPERP